MQGQGRSPEGQETGVPLAFPSSAGCSAAEHPLPRCLPPAQRHALRHTFALDYSNKSPLLCAPIAQFFSSYMSSHITFLVFASAHFGTETESVRWPGPVRRVACTKEIPWDHAGRNLISGLQHGKTSSAVMSPSRTVARTRTHSAVDYVSGCVRYTRLT